ncbi:MAG: DNA methyltransferase [Fimbriimonadales bacterium]|nr:DNA methyltransferase [Fimbriimonadales bacterium]
METADYRERRYLSAVEAARFLGVSVRTVHQWVVEGVLPAQVAASGQYRFDRRDLVQLCSRFNGHSKPALLRTNAECYTIYLNQTTQTIYVKNSQYMAEIPDNSIHLAVTSPPYFNAKMYAREPIAGDLGDIHDLDEWLVAISSVWREVYRALQPGRKLFINIMNLPVRTPNGSFRALNLTGKTIDLCEAIGFIFKRDIVWNKTNSVRAHFGTYPYPGGILINHMHEFILEFEKPAPRGYNKYAHLSDEQKERSKLDKDFWVSLKKSDVWTIKPEGSGDNRDHVAPFPVELPYRLIKAYSYVGETVLDPFVGSGTTLLAAAMLQRHGVGYEINPEIAAGARQRLENAQLTMEF